MPRVLGLCPVEMVGVDEARRGGCEFGIFFNYDATPMDLLQRGIFNSSDTRRLELWDSGVESGS